MLRFAPCYVLNTHIFAAFRPRAPVRCGLQRCRQLPDLCGLDGGAVTGYTLVPAQSFSPTASGWPQLANHAMLAVCPKSFRDRQVRGNRLHTRTEPLTRTITDNR